MDEENGNGKRNPNRNSFYLADINILYTLCTTLMAQFTMLTRPMIWGWAGHIHTHTDTFTHTYMLDMQLDIATPVVNALLPSLFGTQFNALYLYLYLLLMYLHL